MSLNQAEDNLIASINKIKEANNIISLNSISGLIRKFISTLKHSIENSQAKQISWEHPFIKIEYPLAVDNKGIEFIFIKDDTDEKFIEKAIEKNYLEFFKTITKGINITKEKNKTVRKVPEPIMEKFKQLHPDEQLAAIENY